MRFREKISRNEYKEISKRALRLFLSVDIVNSTALKQEFRHRPGESWIGVAHGFYTSFPSSLAAEISKADPPNGNQVITAPEPWKALGDELIFVAEVIAMEDLPPLLNAFRTSTQAWNREFESKGVLIKGAAWLAGFPVQNSAIVGDDEEHLDSLGLSMDIGFRLGHHASPRKFVLSVELAFVLSVLESTLIGEMRFNGSEILKGVLRDTPYPILSLDCFLDGALPDFATLEIQAEKAFPPFRPGINSQELKEYLRLWMQSTKGDICPPFCHHDGNALFPLPPDYDELEKKALAVLEREFLDESQNSPDEGDDGSLEMEEYEKFFDQFNLRPRDTDDPW